MKTNDIKKALMKKKRVKKLSFLSTGSTLLNLACTGNPYYGFAKGHFYFIVGDSISGKTFLALTCLAEASINPEFDDYRFIYDDGEGGALMNIERFFGSKVCARIEAPSYSGTNRKEPVYSTTIEEFYYHVDDALQKEKPFIYILDSMDSLSSEAEKKKFDETKAAYRKGKRESGSFGDGKAKKNSANLRQLLTPLLKKRSILIVINQTRDNLGFGFMKKTRSGGRALRFYATIELWSSSKRKISKIVKGKTRQLGVECCIQIKKNRITGKERTLTIPIYHSFGIDDIGSCVDYLIDEGHWKTQGKKIKASEFKFKGTRTNLIRYIEIEGIEKELRSIVANVWNEIEEACTISRKKRYK